MIITFDDWFYADCGTEFYDKSETLSLVVSFMYTDISVSIFIKAYFNSLKLS